MAFIERWINEMNWKMCGMKVQNGMEKELGKKNVNKNIWAISNVENGFRCCFQQKEQQQQQKIERYEHTHAHTYKQKERRNLYGSHFFLYHSQCDAFVCSSPLLLSHSHLVLSVALRVTLLYLYLMMFGRHSGNGGDIVLAADAVRALTRSPCIHTLCVIKFVDCVPTWIQIIHANNGDVHRNEWHYGFFSLLIISFHLLQHFMVSFVLASFSLSLSRTPSIQWPFAFFLFCSLLVALNLFGFHSLTRSGWQRLKSVHTDILLLLFE